MIIIMLTIIIITLPFTIIIDMQNPQWNHYHQFQKIRKIGASLSRFTEKQQHFLGLENNSFVKTNSS